MQFGILRYFARFAIDRRWLEGWEVIKHRLEDVFMKKWPTMAASVLSRNVFLNVLNKELSLFVDASNVNAIEDCVANNSERTAEAWDDVVSSKLGLTLFAAEASMASWKEHRRDVRNSIADLQSAGFIEEDVLIFIDRMTLQVGE